MKEEALGKISEFILELNEKEALNMDDIEEITNSLAEFNGEKEANETLVILPVDIIESYTRYIQYVEKSIKENFMPITFDDWYKCNDFKDEDEE